MKQLSRLLRPAWAAVMVSLSLPVLAQSPSLKPAPRLAGAAVSGAQTVLTGTQPPRVRTAADLGAVPNDQAFKGITLVFNRSAAQEADVQSLLAAQQNPASPLYHQWLTPDQFAARFGVADADISAVEGWLQNQGFSITGVSRSRTRITFSGNAGQVAQAFGAPLHRFNVGGTLHVAPATDLSVPATLAPMVTAVLHLTDFRPHPALHHVKPAFTSSQTGTHYLTPLDLATMYDVNPVYNAGFNGAGQSVAIAGESFIDTGDITRFQTAAGLPANLPTLVLEPGTGVSSTLDDQDEAESDIDVEYATGMARAAKIFLVYTGDDQTYGALDAVAYAVDQAIAPVISSSYGDCEAAFGASSANAFNQVGEQANLQGETIFSAAGDNGSTDCAPDTDLSSLQTGSLAVDVPASLPTVTGMGGLEMASGASTSSTYWSGASGTDTISSLLSYVPEAIWNEDDPDYGFSAGGGGTSALFTRPSWQAGVPGIPSGLNRLVPDLSLEASGDAPGYVLCTSDASVLSIYGITSSCTNGFRDSSGVLEANYGGTSFAAPIMAGLLAVLNQATNSVGQGNINPILYGLASNATTYASAFHDVTSGSNACVAGTVYDVGSAGTAETCTAGATGYSAGVGYDEASGLGSIDFAKLVAAWPVANTTIPSTGATTTTVTAASATTALNTTDVVTITVASTGGSTVAPTGTVNLISNGQSAGSVQLVNGAVTYTFPGAAIAGSYVVEAAYQGDASHLPSSSAASITVGTTVATGTFTLAAQNITVATNNIGAGTVQLTPGTGYTGLVNFSVVFPSGAPSLCYEFSQSPVSTFYNGASTGPQSVTLEIGEGTVCTTTSAGPKLKSGITANTHAENRGNPDGARPGSTKRVPTLTAFAGLLLAGLAFGRRSRRLSSLMALALIAVLGVGLSGCGSSNAVTLPITGSGSTTSTNYTVTVVGTDSTTATITSSTTLTLTVQ